MKILFNCGLPFALAHGGMQIQIERTKAALESIGIEVDFVRWWDDQQTGDLIHVFGSTNNGYLLRAQAMKMPVVMTSLFSETCNRSNARLARQGLFTQLILAAPFGRGIKQQLGWRAYKNCTHNIVGLEAERHVLQTVYRIPADKISVIPLGLSETYLKVEPSQKKESHLICTGTIRQLKHCTELARMARIAQTPILFVGKPYHPTDTYWFSFKTLIDDQWVKYHSHVNSEAEMIDLLRNARGFVLMSDYENWSLSAHEAIACGLPLLVQDQKWSRERFGNETSYFAQIGYSERNTEILRRFWEDVVTKSAPDVRLYSWANVAEQLKAVYERVLSTSR